MNNFKKQSIAFMAIAAGKEAVESKPFPKYVGVGAVKVLTVNPTKAELSKLFPTREFTEEINYVVDATETKPQSVRIDFWVESIPDKNNGAEFIQKVSYFVQNSAFVNKENTKCQYIDAFGETAWLDKDNPVVPEGGRMSSTGLRKAYRGEESLTKFIKAMLNIPDRGYFKDVYHQAAFIKEPKDLEACYAQLEKIGNYFKGDFSELKTIVSGAVNNKLKLAFGVKTTADNKTYTDIFTDLPMKYSTSKYDYIQKVILNTKGAGRYPDTTFGENLAEFKEYSITPTDLTSAPGDLGVFAEEDMPSWGAES